MEELVKKALQVGGKHAEHAENETHWVHSENSLIACKLPKNQELFLLLQYL